MTEQEIKQIQKGESLDGFKTHSGWKALIEIFQELYNDASSLLIEKEDIDARARIKALQDIMDKINGNIDLAKQLREEFNQKLNK